MSIGHPSVSARAWTAALEAPGVARLRSQPAVLAFVVAAVVAFAALLHLGRTLTFYHDEWTFIQQRQTFDLETLMRPHNEHWSLGIVLWFQGLYALFGLSSYLPYLGSLLIAHVLVAAGVFRLARMVSDGWVALSVGLLMLFFGSGYQNLFWAFQIGFVAATAAGVWALGALLGAGSGRSPAVTAAALLTGAIATQTVGLFFVVAAIVILVHTGTWRGRWWCVAVPLLVYAAWFVIYGRDALSHHRDPLTVQALADVPAYLLTGLEAALSAITGLGADSGPILVALAVVGLLAAVAARREIHPVISGGIAGVVALFALAALVRGQFGDAQATEARYLYVAAALLLPAAAAALHGLRFTGLSGKRRLVLLPLLAMALLANGDALLAGRANFQNRAAFTRAYVGVIEEHADAPAMEASKGVFPYPRPVVMLTLLDSGSPTTDRWFPAFARDPGAGARDRALFALVQDQISVEPAGVGRAPGAVRLAPLQPTDVEVSEGAGCIEMATNGPRPSIAFTVAAGDRLTFDADAAGALRIYLALEAEPQEAASLEASVVADEIHLLTLPQLEGDTGWTLRLDLPEAASAARVCGIRGDPAP